MDSIFQAIIDNDLQLVDHLIQNDSEIIFKEYNEQSSFVFACAQNKLSIVKKLVYLIPGKSSYIYQALFAACKNGHLDIIKFLLFTFNYHTFIIIVWASLYNHLHIIQYLVNNNTNFNHFEHDTFDFSSRYSDALTTAVEENHIEIVKYLYELYNTNSDLKFLIHDNLPLFPSHELIIIAMENGNINMLSYLYDILNYPINDKILDTAIDTNNNDIINYIYDNLPMDYIYPLNMTDLN